MFANKISIHQSKYDSNIYTINYNSEIPFKNRIDICEPMSIGEDSYYNDYYELNHSSFLVLSFNTNKLEVLLYDTETGHVYSSLTQKPIYKYSLNDNNTLKLDGRVKIENNFIVVIETKPTSIIDIAINKLLTYIEFMHIGNYKEFYENHYVSQGCRCCADARLGFINKLDEITEKDYLKMYRLLERCSSVYLYNRVLLDKIVAKLNTMVLNLYRKNYYPVAHGSDRSGDYCNRIVNIREYLLSNI